MDAKSYLLRTYSINGIVKFLKTCSPEKNSLKYGIFFKSSRDNMVHLSNNCHNFDKGSFNYKVEYKNNYNLELYLLYNYALNEFFNTPRLCRQIEYCALVRHDNFFCTALVCYILEKF